MKIECISISSSDDDNLADLSDNEGNDYSSLCRCSWMQCDFCDREFDNRFSLIKHNASHIIIPLIKQTHQCTICLAHFTSVDDLNTHTLEIHEEKVKEIDILQSIVEKQVFVKCEDDFKEVFLNKQIIGKIKNENVSPKKDFLHKKEILHETPLERGTVRNRLLFEDEDDDDDDLSILKDKDCAVEYKKPINTLANPITTFDNPIKQCNIPINTFYNPINSFPNQVFENFSQKLLNNWHVGQEPIKAQDESQKSQEIDVANHYTEVVYAKSVHYDELIEENESSCRFCGKTFPNRFEMLKHEPKHLIPKKFRHTVCGFCERYIAGNYKTLRKHINEKHPEKKHNKFNLHKCKKCQLCYFNYNKHINLHHAVYKCAKCNAGYEKEEELNGHYCENYNRHIEDRRHNENYRRHNEDYRRHNAESKSAMLKLCEMCHSFMRIYIQNRHNYVEMGELSEIGVMQVCDKCNNKFFAVKLLKRESLVKDNCKHRGKGLSNMDRLKRVQQRLKIMQNRNKF